MVMRWMSLYPKELLLMSIKMSSYGEMTLRETLAFLPRVQGVGSRYAYNLNSIENEDWHFRWKLTFDCIIHLALQTFTSGIAEKRKRQISSMIYIFILWGIYMHLLSFLLYCWIAGSLSNPKEKKIWQPFNINSCLLFEIPFFYCLLFISKFLTSCRW